MRNEEINTIEATNDPELKGGKPTAFASSNAIA
jgi:hypothetical protein